MEALPFVERVLDDESLTAGLPEAEAEILLGWLVAAVDEAVESAADEHTASDAVAEFVTRTRRMAGFVRAWCYDEDTAGAERIAQEALCTWSDTAREIGEHPSANGRPRAALAARILQTIIDMEQPVAAGSA